MINHIARNIFNCSPYHTSLRNKNCLFFYKRFIGAYDSDGKTVGTVLNKKDRNCGKLLMLSFNSNGFTLTNGAMIFGPCILFPNLLLGWNINGDHEINEKSLDFFFHLQPKLHLLIIGIGEKKMMNKIAGDVLKLAIKHKINIEIQDVSTACGTYNFLAGDDLHIAGAFIPPLHYEFGMDDIHFTKQKHNVQDIAHMRDGEAWF